jgi:hypothetical protein
VPACAAQCGRGVDVYEVLCATRDVCRPQRAPETRLPPRQSGLGGCHLDEHRMAGKTAKPRPYGLHAQRQTQAGRTGIRHIGQEDQSLALDRTKRGQACGQTARKATLHAWRADLGYTRDPPRPCCDQDDPTGPRNPNMRQRMIKQAPRPKTRVQLVTTPEPPGGTRREQDRGAHGRLDLDLAAELDHPVGRQAEEFHRAFGVAQHPGEQLLAPDRHARP